MFSAVESDATERGPCYGPLLFEGHPSIEQGQLRILHRARTGDQVETLEHEPNLPVADVCQLVRPKTTDIDSIEQIPSPCGLVKATQDVHQRRLARTG